MDHDSGAIDHTTSLSHLFLSYTPCPGNAKIKAADGSLSSIVGKGTITISDSLVLKFVLHVPNLSCNLLSISKLTKDLQWIIKFFPSHCKFHDLASGMTIGSAKEQDRLFYFEDHVTLNRQAQKTATSDTFSAHSEIMFWHYRLGHPSFPYLQKLFPPLFKNKNFSSFQCKICQLAKNHHSIFPFCPYKNLLLLYTVTFGALLK